MGGVVRGGECAEEGAGVVRPTEFWVDRVGADVGADQSGAAPRVGPRRNSGAVAVRSGRCRATWGRKMPKALSRDHVTLFHIPNGAVCVISEREVRPNKGFGVT